MVSLTEGPIVSFILLVVTLFTRSFFGGYGVYAAALTYGLTTLFTIKLGPLYLKGTFSRRLLICLSLSLFCSINHLILIQFLSPHTFTQIQLWISYIIIPSIGITLVFIISDAMARYNMMKKELFKAEKAQVVSHLAASFGHEVRNPMTVSRGFLQLLLEEDMPSKKRIEYAKTALKELDHAENIIRSYLTFAKPQFEKKEIFDFREEMNEFINILLPLANMNNVHIHLTEQPESANRWNLEGERKLLHQCLLNICKNSIESMPKGGDLSLQLFSSESLAGLHITDTGNGMTKEQITRLGEPYFSTKEKGTGLGMMVVYSIVKSMQGKIEITSELGKGTTVTLSFPATGTVLLAQKAQ
jgi:two-component system sporulation sensor kinase B